MGTSAAASRCVSYLSQTVSIWSLAKLDNQPNDIRNSFHWSLIFIVLPYIWLAYFVHFDVQIYYSLYCVVGKFCLWINMYKYCTSLFHLIVIKLTSTLQEFSNTSLILPWNRAIVNVHYTLPHSIYKITWHTGFSRRLQDWFVCVMLCLKLLKHL